MPRHDETYIPNSASQQRLQDGPTPQTVHAIPPPDDTAAALQHHLREEHRALPEESLPEQWADSLYVRLPMSDVAWAKLVVYVPPAVTDARDLGGVFLPTAEQRFYADIGSVVLIRKSDLLSIWIVMPGDDEWYAAPMERIAYQPGWLDLVKRPLRGWVGMSYKHRVLRACVEGCHALNLALDKTPASERRQRRELRTALLYFQRTGRDAMGLEGNAAFLVDQFRIWFTEMCAMTNVSDQEILAYIASHTTQQEREVAALAAILTRLERHIADEPQFRQLPSPSNVREAIQQCATVVLQQLGCTDLPDLKMPELDLEQPERLIPLLKPMKE